MLLIRVAAVALILATCMAVDVAEAQESGATEEASPQRRNEIYGAIFVLGSLAKNRNLNVGGEELTSTTVKSGAGGGFKAGVFPLFTGSVLGVQAETFGLGHEITAPTSMGSSGNQSGRGTLLAWTTLASLVVRYPGEQFQPYVGTGAGWSSSLLVKTDLTKGAMKQTGTARDTSFAAQFFAGLRMNLTQRVFLFGEYKYLVSRYAWSGSLQPSLDFRTHIVELGVGLSF